MFTLDLVKLATAYRKAFPPPSPNPAQVAAFVRLAQAIAADPDITEIRWAAYMLATVKRECGNDFLPITEKGQRPYFNKYEPGTPIGIRLGNTQPGDGFLYRGRGFVQLTGRPNYVKMSDRLNMPGALAINPDLALDFDNAYKIMSYGMRHGSFTGKKLDDYINANGKDYFNARHIINGTDQAALIQGYAESLEIALSVSTGA